MACHSLRVFLGRTSAGVRRTVSVLPSRTTSTSPQWMRLGSSQVRSLLAVSAVRPGVCSPLLKSFHTSVHRQKGKPAPEDVTVIVNVTYEEVVDGLEDDAHGEASLCLLDVRMRDEIRQDGRISKHQLNIPVQELREALTLSDEDFADRYGFPKSELDRADLVTYCLGGIRAKAAAKILHMAGHTRVRCYLGSWEDWVSRQQQQQQGK